MAVERTGAVVTINSASNASSQSITVPSDATFAAVFFGGYEPGSDTLFDSAAISLTLGGTGISYVGRSPSSGENGDLAFLSIVNPPTGSQTFAWTCSAAIDDGYMFVIAFYKGVDTSGPIKDSGGSQGTSGTLSVTGLNAGAGDMAIACTTPLEAPAISNNGQTVLATLGPSAKSGYGYMGVAEKAGSTAMYAGPNTYYSIMAAVIRESGIDPTLTQYSFRLFQDDGSESAATAMTEINTGVTLAAEGVARIRLLVDADNDPSAKQFQLEYRRKPSGGSFGDWRKVN